MRILHTADWHIGKIVNGYSMLEDQAYVLNQLIDRIEDEHLDAVLLSGDLYDRSVPPREAVTLANHLINRIVRDLDLPLLVIAGNHDSNERLEFGADLFAESKLFIEGTQKDKVRRVDIKEASIYLLPFSDYLQTRKILGRDDIKSYQDALDVQVDQIKSQWDPNQLNILMYHGYIINQSPSSIEESDSERQLTIGSLEYVDAGLVEDFDYVALGHLHKAQKVKEDHIRYAGSPLKYSMSEHLHQKQSLIVELDKNKIEIEPIMIQPRYDLRVISGPFEEIMKAKSDDYIFFKLTDSDYVFDAMKRLKSRYPHAMALDYESQEIGDQEIGTLDVGEVEKMNPLELFEDFYQRYKGQKLAQEKRELLISVINQAREELEE